MIFDGCDFVKECFVILVMMDAKKNEVRLKFSYDVVLQKQKKKCLRVTNKKKWRITFLLKSDIVALICHFFRYCKMINILMPIKMICTSDQSNAQNQYTKFDQINAQNMI